MVAQRPVRKVLPGAKVDPIDGILDAAEGIIESKIVPTSQIVRAYLDSRRYSNYGRMYSIKSKEGYEEAVEWLTKEVDKINAIRNMVIGSSESIDVVMERVRQLEG